jgi:hypothetical protein
MDTVEDAVEDHKRVTSSPWWAGRRRGVQHVAKEARDGSLLANGQPPSKQNTTGNATTRTSTRSTTSSTGPRTPASTKSKGISTGAKVDDDGMEIANISSTGSKVTRRAPTLDQSNSTGAKVDVDDAEMKDLAAISKKKENERDAASAFITRWFSNELNGLRSESADTGRDIKIDRAKADKALDNLHDFVKSNHLDNRLDAADDERDGANSRLPIAHPDGAAGSSRQRQIDLNEIDKRQAAAVEDLIVRHKEWMAMHQQLEGQYARPV